MNSDNVCNYEELKKFVLEFDPIYERYLVYTKSEEKEEKEKKLRKYLDTLQRSEPEEKWSLEEIEDTYLTVKKVYGDDNDGLCEVIEYG